MRRSAAVLRHRHDMHADAEGRAELPQTLHVTGGAGSKRKVVAAEQLLCVKAVHQHLLHKILRRQRAELVKRCLLVFLDA